MVTPLALNLSETENIVLSIMAQGEDMLAIGSWEDPIKSLVAKGFVQKVGNGYRITPAGQQAFDEYETAEMRGMVAEHNARVKERDAPVIDGVAEELVLPDDSETL